MFDLPIYPLISLFIRLFIWTVCLSFFNYLPSIRRVFHVWFRNGFYLVFCHTMGNEEECDHCLPLFRRGMLPFIFFHGVFPKTFYSTYAWLHLDAEQLPSFYYSLSNLSICSRLFSFTAFLKKTFTLLIYLIHLDAEQWPSFYYLCIYLSIYK